MPKIKVATLVLAIGLLGAACNLQPAPSSQVYGGPAVGRAAVDEFFPEPSVNGCAHRIAERESHHYPTSDNGNHHGIFQLMDGYWGSLWAAAYTLNEIPNWHSARQNALAARIIFNQSGWGPWGGCPR